MWECSHGPLKYAAACYTLVHLWHWFVLQARQLYEMILVRHGLMLVGLSFGGKTSIYK